MGVVLEWSRVVAVKPFSVTGPTAAAAVAVDALISDYSHAHRC